MVSNLARGLTGWLRGSCWGSSPSETSASSRHDRTCSSHVVVNRVTSSKYQHGLERLSEESAIAPSVPRIPSLIADVASASSRESTAKPYKQVHATTCSMETAASQAPLVLSQQPLTIAFTNTAPLFPADSASLPSTASVHRSDSAISSYAAQMESEGVDEFSDFEMECLLIHNDYRQKHGVPPLRLNKEMCAMARGMATGLCGNVHLPVLTLRDIDNKKKMCQFAEGIASALCGNTQLLPSIPDRKYGEIVLVTRSPGPVSAYEACHKWYGQSHGFKFGSEPKASKSRRQKCNFTQMVWKGTRELGIGTAYVDGTSAVIGLYYPAGNVSGQYAQNVPRPQDLGHL